ncbi:MAG: TetR/AcrR family transcriptional regulator [Acidimicrobiales bacterium]
MTVGVKAAAATEPASGAHRGRGEAADTAILDAAIEVLCEQGYGGLTMSTVIERAGVSSATLYRRWPTKLDLVMAAVEAVSPEKANTDTGSLDGDIRAFITHIATSVAHRRQHIVEALAAGSATHPELDEAIKAKFITPRLVELRGILARAKERGELASVPSAETAASFVSGPAYHRAYVLGLPLTPRFVQTATTFALNGLGATTTPRPR